MSIDAMWIQVSCDRCGTEIEVELETDSRKSGSWPRDTDRLYEHLERMGWSWTSGVLNRDICPTCSDGPTKDDVADYRAYHSGEGVHTP